MTDVIAIATFERANLALKRDGTVVSFGSTCQGDNIANGLSGVVAIAAGACHSVAVVGQALPAAADLAVTVSDSADPMALGDAYVYTATIINNGPSAATAAAMNVIHNGAASTVLSTATSQGSCTATGTTVTCALGYLPNGASATITIIVEPAATGTISAAATAFDNEPDPLPGNNTANNATTISNAHWCTIIGTTSNDTITGTNGNDVICALGRQRQR